jgi:chaperonin GroES
MISSLSQLDPSTPVKSSSDGLRGPDPETVRRLKRWAASPNIAMIGRGESDDGDVEISDEELGKLGMAVCREFTIDKNSRAEWEEKTRDAMNLAMQIAETKQYPWSKASNVLYPVLTTAAIQFNARAYPAIVMGRSVVKGVVIGPDDGVLAAPVQPPGGAPQGDAQAQAGGGQLPPQAGALGPGAAPPPSGPTYAPGPDGIPQVPGLKQSRADKIGEHMSYQLLDEQEEWEPEMDKLLLVLPIVGCEFKKTYWDSDLRMNVSSRVSAMNLVVNYHAKSLERTPRITELVEYYPHEIKQMENSGVFRHISYHSAQNSEGDDDAPVRFLEQHRWWDFDNDGMKEPYIVTVEEKSQQVVRVVARFEVDKIDFNFSKGRIQKIVPVHYYTKYGFLPNPDGGFYDIGFGQLLKPLNEAINTTLNMLVDAGHLSNVQGGFVGKGLSMNAGSLRFQPGEWKTVNVSGAAVRDSLVPLKFDGPSPVLFQLLEMLIGAAKEVSGVKDVLTGEALPANTPATTMLAMIEQGLKTYTAIYKRVHRSLKEELAKLYRLNRLYLNDEASYKVGDTWKSISRADYAKGSGVEPVSDPTIVTDMQKLGQAQFLAQFLNDPHMMPLDIRKRMLKAANIPNIDQLINLTPPPNPVVMVKAAELALKGHELQVKQEEQAQKRAHENAALQLRERHDAALIEKEQASALESRSRGVLNLAQADVAVGMMQVAALQHQLDAIKAQMDAIADARLADTQAAIDPGTTTPGTPDAGAPGGGQPGAQS